MCSSMKRAILEVVASGVANTPKLVRQYANCTFLAVSLEEEEEEERERIKGEENLK